MRGLRLAGIVIGGLVALLVLGLFAVYLFVNPNDFKPRIVKAVKEATGRDLALPGQIKLSVFPAIALELGPAKGGNPAGFATQPFAAVKHFDLHVALLPLLHKECVSDAWRSTGWTCASRRTGRARATGRTLAARTPSRPRRRRRQPGRGWGRLRQRQPCELRGPGCGAAQS